MPAPPVQPRIVVVDDDDAVRFLVTALLNHVMPEARVTAFSFAQQALGAILRGEADLLITNCQMPDMDGPSLIRAVRERAFHLPIIMISGSLEAADLGAQAGVDSFIAKADIDSQLPNCVRMLLQREG